MRSCRAIGLIVSVALVQPGHAQENLVAHKVLSPETALEMARAALDACRNRGFQVAVAVVDRFGQPQVMLRDRFAGPHTPTTATGKGWTAVSFRTNTTDLLGITGPNQPQAGLRDLPNVGTRGRDGDRSRRFGSRRNWRIWSARRCRRRRVRTGWHRSRSREAGVLTAAAAFASC